MVETASTPTTRELRRRPAQARSRERFDKVLDAASALIADRGLAPITMTEIADEAGMPLTALYRYFPNKGAIVRELALRLLDGDAQWNVERVGDDSLSPHARIVRDVTAYCRMHADPVRLQIRAAIHADAELSQLDLEDSRRNAATIAAAIDDDELGIGRLELERRAMLMVELLDGVARLAVRLDPDDAEIAISTFAEMAAWTLLRPTPFKGSASS